MTVVVVMVLAVMLAVVARRVVGAIASLGRSAEADRQRHRGDADDSTQSLDHLCLLIRTKGLTDSEYEAGGAEGSDQCA
jgi:hypothetical protein